jgi:hypothetical protein
MWSTGRELNPRVSVLQTDALTTSPPVRLSGLLISIGDESHPTGRTRPHLQVKDVCCPKDETKRQARDCNFTNRSHEKWTRPLLPQFP